MSSPPARSLKGPRRFVSRVARRSTSPKWQFLRGFLKNPVMVGSVIPSSKVLIAYADPAVQESILQSIAWPPMVDLDQYRLQLQEVLTQGYATSFEEREEGAAALSSPIFDRSGTLAAALSVSGPASRLTMQTMRDYAPVMIEAARRMGTMIR